jgi:hypothetical protein
VCVCVVCLHVRMMRWAAVSVCLPFLSRSRALLTLGWRGLQLLKGLPGVRLRLGSGSPFLRAQRMHAFEAVAAGTFPRGQP